MLARIPPKRPTFHTLAKTGFLLSLLASIGLITMSSPLTSFWDLRSINSGILLLIYFELLMILGISVKEMLILTLNKVKIKNPGNASNTTAPYLRLILGLLLFITFFFAPQQFFLSPSIISPSNPLSREFAIFPVKWLSRLWDPCLVFVFVSLLILCTKLKDAVGRRSLISAIISLVALKLYEAFYLIDRLHQESFFSGGYLSIQFHAVLVQLFLLSILFTQVIISQPLRSAKNRPQTNIKPIIKKSLLFWLTITVALNICMKLIYKPEKLLTGTYFYSWFPENWKGGYIGKKQNTPIGPLLGEYSSASTKVFEQQLAWMKFAGIDFIIFDWWPKRPDIRRQILKQVRQLSAHSNMHFALHYESLDLRENNDILHKGETSNILLLTPKIRERFVSNMKFIAKHYFKLSNYLKIGKRPVIILYATRHLVGPFSLMLEEARRAVRAEIGVEPFFIGDEAFYNVVDSSHGRVYLKRQGKPNWKHLASLDAITTYNPYDPTQKLRKISVFFQIAAAMYSNYQYSALQLGIPFIPSAIPGYNDRGVRFAAGHQGLSRSFIDHEGKTKSFFQQNLKLLVTPFLDKDIPMFSVTSWNEWNEGTQIEPASLLNKDFSKPISKGALLATAYGPYKKQHLNEMRTFGTAEKQSRKADAKRRLPERSSVLREGKRSLN